MFTIVRHKSGTVANDVRFLFEHAVDNSKTVFPFPLCPAKLISIYFGDAVQTRPSYL